MLFFSVCLVFHPHSALLHSFWMAGTFRILRRVDVRSAGHAKDALEFFFKGLQWFNSKNGLLGQGTKKRCYSWTCETFLKEHSTVVKEHNRSVSRSRPPPFLPSHGQMFVKALKMNLCCPSASCRLSLHCGSASNQSTGTVHFHRFTSPHLPTVYSILEACRKHVLSPLGLTETSECLCTELPTVVHLCCTRAWWGPGEAD